MLWVHSLCKGDGIRRSKAQAISTGPLRCPVRSIVQEFYGSAVMNFIT